VYAVIYRMTGSHSETDDLCQETFLQIFRSLSRFRPGTLLDSWVYRIATNVSVDYLRRKSKERAAEGVLRDRAARSQQVAEPLEADLAAAARGALETLPPEQKAVVVLRLFEGLSHEEIAAVVEAPVATVRWRFFSALEKLSSVLGEAVRP
jgi:RNA polymerase sigma-70 factor (ECF subfamily)